MEFMLSSIRKVIGRLKRKWFRFLEIGKLRNQIKRAKKLKYDIRPHIRAMLAEQKTRVTDFVNPVMHKLNKGVQPGQGLSKEYIETFLKSIHVKWNSPERTTELEDVLRSMTVKADANLLPASQWLAVYNACFSFGLLGVLEPLRDNAVESANIDEKKHPDKLQPVEQAFRAAMDQGYFQKAEELLKRLEKLLKNRDTFLNYQVYYLLQTGQRAEASKPARELVRNHDYRDRFRKLVEGKRIAVVGPAPTGEQTGKEIDAYDLVVRMNYLGSDRIKDTKEFGQRTDISYYNRNDSRYIQTLQNRGFFDDLQFTVFKGSTRQYQKKLIKLGISRALFNANLFFNGVPTLGQFICCDLLLFEPKEIKLFKINFFISDRPYADSYRDAHVEKFVKRKSASQWGRLFSFADHDMLSLLSFTRNLVNAGILQVDEPCRRIFSISNSEYLTGLERIYVENIWNKNRSLISEKLVSNI